MTRITEWLESLRSELPRLRQRSARQIKQLPRRPALEHLEDRINPSFVAARANRVRRHDSRRLVPVGAGDNQRGPVFRIALSASRMDYRAPATVGVDGLGPGFVGAHF